MRRGLALILALLLVSLGIYLARPRPGTAPAISSEPKPSPVPSPPGEPSPPVAPAPELNATKSAPAIASPVTPGAGSQPGATGAMPLDEIHRVIAQNSVPGRMVFLDFVLDRTGVRAVGATGAAGRAKPGGSRAGFGFVHYEVFGPAGDLLLSGSVEDPTRRRIEHPAATDDGRITSTVQFSDEGALAIRLPGEIAAARIVFFRDKNPLAPGASLRENLGEFPLRPQP